MHISDYYINQEIITGSIKNLRIGILKNICNYIRSDSYNFFLTIVVGNHVTVLGNV